MKLPYKTVDFFSNLFTKLYNNCEEHCSLAKAFVQKKVENQNLKKGHCIKETTCQFAATNVKCNSVRYISTSH